MKNFIIMLTMAAITIFSACKKDQGTGSQNNNNDTLIPVKVVLEDTLCRKWRVDKSTHNGDPDPGTTGLEMEFYKGGTYKLISTGYYGTWEFIENNSKILIDRDEPKFRTTWTILKLSSKQFYTSFVSPFSGGNVYWEMKSY